LLNKWESLHAKTSWGNIIPQIKEVDLKINLISRDLSSLFSKTIEDIRPIVCKIQVKEGEGSGFLAHPNILVTSHHVIPSLDVAREATFTFFKGNEKIDKQFHCREIITNSARDYTLILISEYIPFAFSPLLAPMPNELKCCFLITHSGYDIQLSLYPRKVIKQSDTICYSGPSIKGISGSPIFNESFQLVGIHIASIDADCLGFR
jgi:hypothetical protein